MDLSSLDLTPVTAQFAKGAAQLPAANHCFPVAMQSVAVLAAAVAVPVAYHPWLYAGGFLLATAGAAFTLWRVRLAKQVQGS